VARKSFAERAGLAIINPMGRKLFETMEAKQSNLCVAADVGTAKELLELADKVYILGTILYLFVLVGTW
jgi:stromal membrane-associated protein/uridine monophosphate synthetase